LSTLEDARSDRFSVSKLGLYILGVLTSGPLHGYAIRQEIEQASDGRLSPSAATLYENIAKLLEGGLIERAGEKVVGEAKIRKLYRITGTGARALDAELGALQRARATAPSRQSWAASPAGAVG
jgi:DNA-binding PadR family transcriptional regulator